MTFGIGKIAYSNLYVHDYEKYAEEVVGTATSADGAAKEIDAIDHLATDVVIEGVDYVVQTGLSNADAVAATSQADNTNLSTEADDPDDTGDDRSVPGDTFTADANTTLTTGQVAVQEGQLRYAASEGLFQSAVDTNLLTAQIEDVQKKINTARVQAGSQYAALESAVSYTTDLTAQYELGFNTVNDVNFSMETAHLAKNQILQQAATAMLAQANSGQQSLLQLIQG